MVAKKASKTIHLIGYLEELQSKGRLTFTSSEAIKALGLSQIAFNRSAERLIAKKRLLHPSRSFFVIVPAEHLQAGAPPVSWFIDALMKFHEQPYYVGVLSAAALHGAAHQSPQEFQIVTSAPLRPIRVGRASIRFLTKKGIEQTSTQKVRTPFGDIPISTPEATAFDLVQYVHRAGELSNVATVLIEMAEKIDAKKLAAVAKTCGETTVVQRVGYLLDTFTDSRPTADLHEWLEKQRPKLTALRPNWKAPKTMRPKKDDKWRLVINEVVEPDV
ncbi:MAG: type IV toxin-antitoxin system AbiEi family antitoxin [Bdellovibrio sp.]|nr:type IV toxin-antitoxin system AbiEi family antitoxin [Bdellovibrio sp.]